MWGCTPLTLCIQGQLYLYSGNLFLWWCVLISCWNHRDIIKVALHGSKFGRFSRDCPDFYPCMCRLFVQKSIYWLTSVQQACRVFPKWAFCCSTDQYILTVGKACRCQNTTAQQEGFPIHIECVDGGIGSFVEQNFFFICMHCFRGTKHIRVKLKVPGTCLLMLPLIMRCVWPDIFFL